jgi:hypothetical protein
MLRGNLIFCVFFFEILLIINVITINVITINVITINVITSNFDHHHQYCLIFAQLVIFILATIFKAGWRTRSVLSPNNFKQFCYAVLKSKEKIDQRESTSKNDVHFNSWQFWQLTVLTVGILNSFKWQFTVQACILTVDISFIR